MLAVGGDRSDPIHPGFMALHSHRTENLVETVVAWLRAHPLRPLEEAVFIVQSNAVAEWLKMAACAMDAQPSS